MRIVFVADTYYPHINGVYYFVQRLASGLQNKGHEVIIIAPSENIYHTQKKIDGIVVNGISSISILIYKSIRLPTPFLSKPRIKKILKNFNPDIIHIQGHFKLSRLVIEINKNNKPVLATNHFMPENLTSFVHSPVLRKRIERWLWKSFSRTLNKVLIVTTPTETAAKLIRPFLNVRVIPISNGIDLQKFNADFIMQNLRSKYNIPDRPILLYVGRLDPEKHLDEALKGVASALARASFCFVIAGKGVEKNNLKKLSVQLKIENDVVFTDFVPDDDLHVLYNISYCFITASIAELQSIATMEAMASGLPVIAANAGALNELVHNGENGFLFEPGDLVTLADRIADIFLENDLHEKMKKTSLLYIKEHDINQTVREYEKLYTTQYGVRQTPVSP